MIFAFNNTGVEMTVEELCAIIEAEKFDEFFDFLLDMEEEGFFHQSPGEKTWEIELTAEQEDKFLEHALQNWESFEQKDGDLNSLSEEELLNILFGGTDSSKVGEKETDEDTQVNETLMRLIRRLG